MKKHTFIIIGLMLLPGFAAAQSPVVSGVEPYEQDFVLTAYYSPLPGQCCYVKGGEKADKILNGHGTHAADGTAVYPGMIAAPASYAFGTVVELPGLGTFEVHDRGGAIIEKGDGTHRLDVWVGHGEEGGWLVRWPSVCGPVRGTVHADGGPAVAFDLESIGAPDSKLDPYAVHSDNLLAVTPRYDESGPSVRLLQQHLADAGYFTHSVTGWFGPVTRDSLAHFIRDYGTHESAEQLGSVTAAHLRAAAWRSEGEFPVDQYVSSESAPLYVQQAQRLMRFLGYYRGRTDGVYRDNLYAAILAFQQAHGLVGDASSPGAGRIGPLTTAALQRVWNAQLVDALADRYLLLHEVDQLLTDRGEHIEQYLGEGYSGDQVRLLQHLLADRGFFPAGKINGNFGPLTKSAVLQYQLANDIVSSASDGGAGYVGPMTLRSLRSEQRRELYRLVRAEGRRQLLSYSAS